MQQRHLYRVTANNGTAISIEARSLLIMFTFMLIDTILISLVILFMYPVFDEIRKGFTPFSHGNTVRIKRIAILIAILSIAGSYSDSLVDYYTIGELTWRVNIAGMIVAIIIYCISLIFSYGCELQRESGEDGVPKAISRDSCLEWYQFNCSDGILRR